jgi:hypothetical protein
MCAVKVKDWGMTGSRRDAYSAEHASERYEGKPVVRMWRSAEGDDGFGAMFQMFKPDEYRGKRVRFSAALRTRDVSGNAALCFRVDGAKAGQSGQSLAFDNMDARPPIVGTTKWERHACVLEVVPEATAIFISNILSGSGELYWADLRFEVVDDSVPLTDMGVAHGLRDSPANLDFASA